jgi:hypothetical protein
VRCPYCGNENPGDHKFCGMCGRPLVETRPEPRATPADPTPTRDFEPASPAPAYTGGLFNLGAPPDKPHRDLDYLLEDDEEKSSNKGLILLTLIAVLLVVGLGWLRWRNSALPFLRSLTASSQPKPSAPKESAPTDSSAPTPNPQNPEAATGSAGPEGSAQTAAPSAEGSITPITPPNSAGNPPTSSTPDPNAAAATPPASPSDSGSHELSKEETAEKSAPSEAEAAAPPPPAPAKPKPVAKPAPKPPTKSTDPVLVGERYLYGKAGFPQNCERGLHYVKPAADQSNPKAMITMGALYATGHCLSKDLPTAYRYFALALRGDPENGPLRQNAEMVWKQMTSEERKQAIRLTQ